MSTADGVEYARKARIRVALLTPSLNPGGTQRQMLLLAEALPPSTFEVTFLLMSERGAFATTAERHGITVHVLGLRPGKIAGLMPRAALDAAGSLRSYYRLTRGVDIVDAWLPPAYTFAGLAQPIVRVPILFAGRRSMLDVHRSRSWYREVGASLAMRRVDTIVANSRAAANQAITHERLDRQRVHVVHNAVLPFAASDDRRAILRTQWGALDTSIVVGCVSNFLPGKGHDLLLDAAALVHDANQDTRFVFVGDGPLRSHLMEEISRRSLENVVTLLTGVDDARSVYCGFDLHVQASISEGMPNAVLEAAAAGLSNIATDVGGTGEIITDGVDGILIASGDAVALAAGITRLSTDATLRSQLGARARSRSSAFSSDRLAAETAALYLQSVARVAT